MPPALLVGQPHPLARAQRAAVDAGPGLGGTSGRGSGMVLGRGHAAGALTLSGAASRNARSTSAVDQHAEDRAVVLDQEVLVGRACG